MTSVRWRSILAVALLVVVTIGAVAPIRSYDFFWHLATGRWIVQHQALPASDPFTIASDKVPWINGEWLFQLLLAMAQRAFGFAGLSVANALLVAVTFTLIFLAAARESDLPVALAATALAFAGAWGRLDVRPSTAAALFVAAAIVLLSRPRNIGTIVAYAGVTALWINIHPSALLAPLLALLAMRELSPRALALPLASAMALLANPYGWRAIAAPIELTAFVGGGRFINAEWLPSPPALFPLLYLTVLIGVAAFAAARARRTHLWRFAIFALLAYLAIAHVRNQGLYFAAWPLLVAPMLAAVPIAARVPRGAFYALAGLPLAFVLLRAEYRLGVDSDRFPLRATGRLLQSGLPGNIYNPDQFGGFLIWAFAPQRRVLTDGRNELYHRYIKEYAGARLDGRAWQALLKKYRIDLAVDEYREPLETINAVTGRHQRMPASLAYWPRRDWALIGYDHAGMVFARRAAFPKDVLERWELPGVVPDGPG
ncbi:MAG: hypothetical protein JWN02_276 [Acidobacteria bacterium]|nr:hypothetical protein [Acidobacteriota bacterium]